jgi:hypothetical protein
MPLMARRLFTLLSALSLLLCVAVVAMWVQGRRAHTALIFARQGKQLWMLHTYRERLWLYKHEQWPVSEGPRWRTAPVEHGGGVYNVSSYGLYGSWDKEWWFVGMRGMYGVGAVEIATDGRPIWVDGEPDYHMTSLPPTPFWRVGAPFWTIVAVTLVVPAARVAHALRGRSKAAARPHQCQTCGYDLRATPGRCPECGTVAGKQA